MSSWQARSFSFFLRHTFKRKLARAHTAEDARRLFNTGGGKPMSGVRYTPAVMGGVPGEWVEPDRGSGQATLLYLHGGGYFACSPRSHRPITGFYARQGFRVFVPDYRLAPEHPFPAAIDDAESVYRALLDSGVPSSGLVISGDSAGGGLCLSLLLRLRERGIPLPAGAALFSPLTDLAGTGESLVRNDKRCAMFFGSRMGIAPSLYLGDADPRNPLASPLYADLAGLPPLLIHVGEDEVLLDDSTRLAALARDAGVPVELRTWPAVPHVWQLFHGVIPEGVESLASAGVFLKQRILDGSVPLSSPNSDQPDFETIIVGSGFSGLGMAMQLKKAGRHAFILLEKADDIGGTWRDNTYPGCACDVPSHMYSFSFERKSDWSRMYSTQPEIFAYLKHCARKNGLGPHIRLRSEMRDAVYDEAKNSWKVTMTDGRSLTARFLVSALGALSRPAYPQLPGLERFKGKAFHSAEWDHSYDLSGKRVAVIGTGASAVQFIPKIAPQVSHLAVFQRTPVWVLPKMDRPISSRERAIYEHVPGAMGAFRNLIYWRQEFTALGFLHPKLMKRAEELALRHVRRQISDPTLRKKVTPRYTLGCKRVLISNDYFPALARPNVHLVTEGVDEITERGVLDRSGVEHPVDTIIYGTGFRVTDLLSPVRIIGRNGVDLNEAWRNGPEAFLGLMAAGYPNLFMLLGPNTGLGHNSVVFMAEQQIRHALRCMSMMRRQKKTSIEVNAGAQNQFNLDIQRRLQTTVWASGCKSWYLNENGKNVTLWPGFTFEYWRRMKKIDMKDYRLA
ncbi:MAG TPA: alpha/beta hydrolase fold domain-containing protein [Noviherbaspirillum sp.]|jgi:cation diffusion facilitator CzcD-associated flavoprotein CzcO/acetyl esterase/lipase|uniref:alpha/beta hydrolase fold domain-containing protein n=1 Tax=Noviherbaspirillum sp. TaxID=1926288 RepID=UPI002DDD3C4A|nr:alpha/beta hydrolase fold domain-containing protein [Noviherbaspirillum sp.]HEV2611653.1 alpha/beta hydrolase fold domain-containing protein [Noviherbaspirillum sp.]